MFKIQSYGVETEKLKKFTYFVIFMTYRVQNLHSVTIMPHEFNTRLQSLLAVHSRLANNCITKFLEAHVFSS